MNKLENAPNLQPKEVLSQEAIDAFLSNPVFQELISQAVESKMLDAKPDFIPNYQIASTSDLSQDDEDFLNREQLGHLDLEYRDHNVSRNLESIIPDNSPQVEKPLYRPYSAIINDINTEKSATVKRHYTTISGKLSKNVKEFSVTDKAKVEEHLEEIAARVLTADYKEGDDERLNVLIELQERGNLSDEEINFVMDKMGEYASDVKSICNITDEIVQTKLVPELEKLIAEGKNPYSFFRGKDKKLTLEYKAIDKLFAREISGIENPIIRTDVLKEINEQIQNAIEQAKKSADNNQAIDKQIPQPQDDASKSPKVNSENLQEEIKEVSEAILTSIDEKNDQEIILVNIQDMLKKRLVDLRNQGIDLSDFYKSVDFNGVKLAIKKTIESKYKFDPIDKPSPKDKKAVNRYNRLAERVLDDYNQQVKLSIRKIERYQKPKKFERTRNVSKFLLDKLTAVNEESTGSKS